MRAEQITPNLAYHLEGPCWWPGWGGLRFVDMLGGAVLTLEEGGRVGRIRIGSPVAAVIRPRMGGGAIVARERDVAVATKDDLSDLAPVTVEFVPEGQRNNEGGCDPQGRFWIGTMAYDHSQGVATLYTLGGTGLERALDGVTISNGLAWSPEGTTVYYNDSPTSTCFAFDYDPVDGLSHRRVFARIEPEQGYPDGLCVDSEGGVWIALYDGGAVLRFDSSGTLTERVELGVGKVTAATFGGPDLDTLYITTSREGLADGVEPDAGSLWAVRPGARGLPALPYAG